MAIDALSHDIAVRKCEELAALVTRHTDDNGDGTHTTLIKKLKFIRKSDTFTVMQGIGEPALAIVVQGRKQTLLGEQTYQYGAAQYLLVSVDLPLCGCVIEATAAQPYLGLKVSLDPAQLCEIITQNNFETGSKENSVRGWDISNAAPSLIDCVIRLTQLLDTPQDIAFLAPMVIREIYYRLLVGEQSEAVRQIATSGSTMQRIAEVIKEIRTDFTKPLRVEKLAEQALMAPSSFHRHFKQVTSMSPLQYQKQLRLVEARRLMLAEKLDATSAAFMVGYESASQFSREYSRMFGAPPRSDIERLRTA
ncbi:MAG: AraC family transcriptional regulator [Leptolyngbyaceae cyanobacterium SM1_4_3]|nr:AraC family transcriptional regulator [Leptolyngbyaceae cyanobacterium SM1_4_3]